MVPLADFCNHSYTRSLSHFEFLSGGKEGSDCVSLVCDTDVKIGDEVHICYGPKSTAQLLSFYGFEMGMPVPCDELHVDLIMPQILTNSKEALAVTNIKNCDCCEDCAADECFDFLSKCCLSISDDNSVSCTLWSSPMSVDSTDLFSISALPSTVASSPSSNGPSPQHCLSHHRIVHAQPCIDIPTAVANSIRALRNSACTCMGDCGLSCKLKTDRTALPGQAQTEEVNWLQVMFNTSQRDRCVF